MPTDQQIADVLAEFAERDRHSLGRETVDLYAEVIARLRELFAA